MSKLHRVDVTNLNWILSYRIENVRYIVRFKIWVLVFVSSLKQKVFKTCKKNKKIIYFERNLSSAKIGDDRLVIAQIITKMSSTKGRMFQGIVPFNILKIFNLPLECSM